MKELEKAFSIDGISKSPSVFDYDKLLWFNAEYIKAMTPEAFAAAAEPWIRQAVKNPACDAGLIAALLQQRTEKLTDIPEKLDFFDELPDYDAGLFTNKKSKSNPDPARETLSALLPELEALPEWNNESLLKAMTGLAERQGVKNARVMWPVRIAATGTAVTPGGAVEICRILGREETLRRLRDGLARLS